MFIRGIILLLAFNLQAATLTVTNLTVTLIQSGVSTNGGETNPPAGPGQTNTLTYAIAALDNPLKGFAYNMGDYGPPNTTNFPISILLQPFEVRQVVTASNTYNWGSPASPIVNGHENLSALGAFDKYYNRSPEWVLASCTNLNMQWIPSFNFTDPNHSRCGIPSYLTNGLCAVTNFTSDYGPPVWIPDWNNAYFLECATNLIAQFGAKYDTNPTVGFVFIRMLGDWGEWHVSCFENSGDRDTWWASYETQKKIIYAFTNAFPHKKIFLRYPSGSDDIVDGFRQTRNDNLPVGYTDDNFTQATLGSRRGGAPTTEDFMQQMTNANALTKWKTEVIGAELSNNSKDPDAWETLVWDVPETPKSGYYHEDITNCVKICHTTFMSDTYSPDQLSDDHANYQFTNAMEIARLMGYELWVKQWAYWTNEGTLYAGVWITNTAVAPFYYDWTVQLGTYKSSTLQTNWDTSWDLRTIIPGDGTIAFSQPLTNAPAYPFTLLMRVKQPAAHIRPLRFANATQHSTVTNWLTLGTVQ